MIFDTTYKMKKEKKLNQKPNSSASNFNQKLNLKFLNNHESLEIQPNYLQKKKKPP
jgi:hypothetical protein